MITSSDRPLHMLAPLALAMSIFSLPACSNNDTNNLTVQDEPAMRLEEPASGELELQVPLKEKEPIELEPIRILSSGEVPLTITKIEWVGQKPERVFMAKSRQEGVSEEECSSDIYYPAADICILTGAPDYSTPIPAGTEFGIQLHVKAYQPNEPNVIVCPDEIPAEIPDAFRERYCGAIRITSDARNTAGQVVEGEALVYLQADRSSGSIRLTVPTITFQNVIPGFEAEQPFGIINDGSSPLTVSSVLPADFGQYISVTGPDLPLELAPQESGEFKVKIAIPASENPDLLNFMTQLRIASSAPTSPDLLDIVVDNSRQIPPVPQPDRQKITFAADGDVQSVVMTNLGDIPVSLTGVNFEPAYAEDYYKLLNEDDTPFVGPSVIQKPSSSNPDRNKKTYKIAYTAPDDDTSSLASMIINYNYFVGDETRNGTLRLILLGDSASAAFGDVVPSVATFSTQVTEEQTRKAAIYNLGTAPLEVTGADLNALAGTTDEFIIKLAGGASFPVTIPADGIQPIEISFVGTNTDIDQIDATIESDSDISDTMRLTLSSQDIALPTEEIAFTTSFLDAPATVGELVSVEFSAGTNQSIANNAQWVIYSRPAASNLYVKTIGPKVAFIADAPGTYELLVTSSINGIDVQEVVTFTAE